MKKIIVLSLLLVTTFGYSQNWKTNLEEAKNQAANENKNILVVFSGSDWCAPCMKLEKIVWKSDAFKTEAEKKWVLVRADFPKKKGNQLSKELTESNKLLAEKYNKGGSFPLVVLADKKGKVIGMTGFKNVSAEEYIKIINALGNQ
jgi:thioredoxin-related protein